MLSMVSSLHSYHQSYSTVMFPNHTMCTYSTHAHSFRLKIAASNLTKHFEFYVYKAVACVLRLVIKLLRSTVKKSVDVKQLIYPAFCSNAQRELRFASLIRRIDNIYEAFSAHYMNTFSFPINQNDFVPMSWSQRFFFTITSMPFEKISSHIFVN